jgi:hypothetical protein
MIGIRLAFVRVADLTPPSGEVLHTAIAQACVELKTPVEHIWVGDGSVAHQAVLFLDIDTPRASVAAGLSVGELAACRMLSLRFAGSSLLKL